MPIRGRDPLLGEPRRRDLEPLAGKSAHRRKPSGFIGRYRDFIRRNALREPGHTVFLRLHSALLGLPMLMLGIAIMQLVPAPIQFIFLVPLVALAIASQAFLFYHYFAVSIRRADKTYRLVTRKHLSKEYRED